MRKIKSSEREPHIDMSECKACGEQVEKGNRFCRSCYEELKFKDLKSTRREKTRRHYEKFKDKK